MPHDEPVPNRAQAARVVHELRGMLRLINRVLPPDQRGAFDLKGIRLLLRRYWLLAHGD